MKLSNKLLLTGFLAILLVITAIHVTFYLKYKAGNFSVYNPAVHSSDSRLVNIPAITFISLLNVADAAIRFGPIAQLEKNSPLTYTRNGDTLIISDTHQGKQPASHKPIVVIPYGATLSAEGSAIDVAAGVRPVPGKLSVRLTRSHAFFVGDFSTNELTVTASDSSMSSFEGSHISTLEISLANSSFAGPRGDFQRLSIITDSSSRIALSYKQLAAATITTTPAK